VLIVLDEVIATLRERKARTAILIDTPAAPLLILRSGQRPVCRHRHDEELPCTDRFKGILLTRDDNKVMSVNVTELGLDDLMEGDVVVEVEWTTVNYKDGLAITGKGPVVRRWPMVPGIDCAGTVVSSENERFKAGDKVILNGFGVGEVHTGAYAAYARLNGDWLIPMPEGMDGRSAMAIGTAGYTAMLSVMALERHGITPERGPVVVTGANGGVGTVAIAVLGKLGYEVIASTGRTEEADFLKELGASEVIHRDELSGPAKPLNKERWAGGWMRWAAIRSPMCCR
jgi:acrylyl-CoA reductase (NADPH)